MDSSNAPLVTGKNGLRGRLMPASGDTNDRTSLVLALDSGEQIRIPGDLLVKQGDGTYYVPISPTDIVHSAVQGTEHMARGETALVVPVYEEELNVGKRIVETGRARIVKRVEERQEVVDEPLLRQEVQIDRVPINQMWEGPPPPPRYEADKLVVPLLEEVLVVEKRLMLKEELHISRIQRTVHEPQNVALRSESVSVERVDPATESAEGSTKSS